MKRPPAKFNIDVLLAGDRDVYFDADDNEVAKDDPRAVVAYFAATRHIEELG